jgi:hypothetical protein
MTTDLDDWVASLAAETTDRSLDGLEARIGRDIAIRRRDAHTVRALAPVRMATVGLALAIGVTTGGAAATAAIRTAHPAGPFAAGTQLAPSILLDGVG